MQSWPIRCARAVWKMASVHAGLVSEVCLVLSLSENACPYLFNSSLCFRSASCVMFLVLDELALTLEQLYRWQSHVLMLNKNLTCLHRLKTLHCSGVCILHTKYQSRSLLGWVGVGANGRSCSLSLCECQVRTVAVLLSK